jgi:hypothetical protein
MLDKSNGLIRMRIDLPSDQSSSQSSSQSFDQSFDQSLDQSFDQSFAQPLDVWHASSSPAALANIKLSDAAADIKTKLAFDLRLSDKLIEIVTSAAYFIWPESGAFVQPVAIQFTYNCGLNCSPSAYSGDGLLHMYIETGKASLRAMQLTSLRDQRFSGRLDFSLSHPTETDLLIRMHSLCSALITASKISGARKSPVRPASNQSQRLLADLAPLIQIVLMRFLGIFRLSEWCRLRRGKLQLGQCAIQCRTSHQAFMCADRLNTPPIHQQNAVCLYDRCQTMRDHQTGSVFH